MIDPVRAFSLSAPAIGRIDVKRDMHDLGTRPTLPDCAHVSHMASAPTSAALAHEYLRAQFTTHMLATRSG